MRPTPRAVHGHAGRGPGRRSAPPRRRAAAGPRRRAAASTCRDPLGPSTATTSPGGDREVDAVERPRARRSGRSRTLDLQPGASQPRPGAAADAVGAHAVDQEHRRRRADHEDRAQRERLADVEQARAGRAAGRWRRGPSARRPGRSPSWRRTRRARSANANPAATSTAAAHERQVDLPPRAGRRRARAPRRPRGAAGRSSAAPASSCARRTAAPPPPGRWGRATGWPAGRRARRAR